jgi:hypothetical protein
MLAKYTKPGERPHAFWHWDPTCDGDAIPAFVESEEECVFLFFADESERAEIAEMWKETWEYCEQHGCDATTLRGVPSWAKKAFAAGKPAKAPLRRARHRAKVNLGEK